LQINGALFYYDYAGYQTAQINLTPENPGNPTFRTITVPLRSYGAELEVQARPWANGTFSLNASYTNARYGDFGIYKTYFSMQKVSGVPPLQGNVAYDHRIRLGGWAIGSVTPSMTAGGPLQVSTDRTAPSDPRTFGMIVSFRY